VQVIGVFGVGSGEALFARKASPVTLQEILGFFNRLYFSPQALRLRSAFFLTTSHVGVVRKDSVQRLTIR
jgi:hypothetical protein